MDHDERRRYHSWCLYGLLPKNRSFGPAGLKTPFFGAMIMKFCLKKVYDSVKKIMVQILIFPIFVRGGAWSFFHLKFSIISFFLCPKKTFKKSVSMSFFVFFSSFQWYVYPRNWPINKKVIRVWNAITLKRRKRVVKVKRCFFWNSKNPILHEINTQNYDSLLTNMLPAWNLKGFRIKSGVFWPQAPPHFLGGTSLLTWQGGEKHPLRVIFHECPVTR